jgi:hypothetical protein
MSNARAEIHTQDPLDPAPAHPVRCRVCGEVIGMYEPLIALLRGQPLETSRAAREGVGAYGEECFHRACYTPACYS